MKKIVCLLFVWFQLTALHAQNNEILAGNNSSVPHSEKIITSRRILMDKIIASDNLGIITEMDYLMSLDNEDYIALYPQEFWLLSYWVKNYKSVLRTVTQKDSAMLNTKIKRIPPPSDYLTNKLVERTKAKEEDIISDVRNAPLANEEKDFLLVFFKFINSDLKRSSAHPVQNEINLLADGFLQKYPQSNYNGFIREYMRVKYEKSGSGVAYVFWGGKFLFTPNLSTYFNHPFMLGLTAEGTQNKWLYQLNLGFAWGKTKKDMPLETTIWPSGSKVFGGLIDVSVGRFLIDNDHFGIAPNLGIGIFGFDANGDNNKQPELKEGGIKTNIAGKAGFLTDFKFKPKEKLNAFGLPNNSQTFIRLSYDYIFSPLKNKYTDFSGTVHKITLGIGVNTRRLKRVK